MATPNLDITEVAAAQNQKHITINNALTALDNATQNFDERTITGALTLTASEFRASFVFILDGTPDADFSVYVPADIKRFFSVINKTSRMANIAVVGDGGDFVIIPPEQGGSLYCDGSDVRCLHDRHFEIQAFVSGSIDANAIISQTILTRSAQLLLGAPLARAYAATAPSSRAVFNLQKNNTLIGSVVFNASSNTGTFTVDSSVDFPPGDRFCIVAPSTANAALSDVSFAIPLVIS